MMTDSVRYGDGSPSGSGTAFHPSPDRPPVPDPDLTGPEHRASTLTEGGIDPAELSDEDLIREVASLHRTRLDTLRHASDAALATHLRRTADLETEYLTRHPGREIDPHRLRDG